MLKPLLGAAVLTGMVVTATFAQTSAPTPSTVPTRPAPSAAAPTKAEPIKVDSLVGRDVKNPAMETIGSIDNVVVDPDGKVQQVVISVGGFLGVGSRHVALAWNQIRLDSSTDVAMVDMTKDQLKAAPEVQERRKTAAPAPAPSKSPASPPMRSN